MSSSSHTALEFDNRAGHVELFFSFLVLFLVKELCEILTKNIFLK
jgi:hypothetical protein